MKNAIWGYWLILLGVFIVVIMLLVQNLTSSSTQDYYLIKEITEASMVDAVDYSYYRNYGEIRINKEKFYESFIRRFAETASLSTTYTVNFYGIYEAPPKVSVEIKSKSASFNVVGSDTSFDMVERIDSILEGNQIDENQLESIIPDRDNSGGSTSGDDGGNSSSNPGDDTTTPDDGSGNTGEGSGNTGGYGDDSNPSGNGNTNPGTSTGGGGNTTTPTYTYNPSNSDNQSCSAGISDWWWPTRKVQGTSLVGNGSQNNYVYSTLNDIKNKENHKDDNEIAKGEKFYILGESGNFWAITNDKVSCGWVDSTYMGINLAEYMPEGTYNIKYNITNAMSSGSIYKVLGKNIENVTGKQLYSNDYFPMLQYGYAKKIKDKVLPNLKQKGNYTLVIYDAYRPNSVSKFVTQQVNKIKHASSVNDCKDEYFNCYKNPKDGKFIYWRTSWFITNTSYHNMGCAIDATISRNGVEIKGQSDMHELSSRSAIQDSDGNPLDQYTNFKDIQAFGDIMKKSDIINGEENIKMIASEWWHFYDYQCTKLKIDYKDFWSNVEEVNGTYKFIN